MKGGILIMDFYDEMDSILSKVKKDVRYIERYLCNTKDNNLRIDCCDFDYIIDELVSKVRDLYIFKSY